MWHLRWIQGDKGIPEYCSDAVYDDRDPVEYWYTEKEPATPLTLPLQPARDHSNTHEEPPAHQYSPLQ